MKRFLSACVLLVATALSCGRTSATGSESHFLDTCSDATCGAGLTCICGTCTQTCTTADECSGLASGSACVEVADLPNTQSCSTSGAQAVCDMACSADADCTTAGTDLRCIDGVCRRIVPDVCALPQDAGSCFGAFPKYWHDPATHRCVPFTYGGCDGNANRFDTLEACELACNVVSSSGPSDAGALTCDGIQSAIASSIAQAQSRSPTGCTSAADCTVVGLDNSCYHSCSSLPVSDPAPLQDALSAAEAEWCPSSDALGCPSIIIPCPPPPPAIDCTRNVCTPHGQCPDTCDCVAWDQSVLHDRSGCSGSDLFVGTTAACPHCPAGEIYVAVVNRGQTDFSGTVTITAVDVPDAGTARVQPFSQLLSIPSGDFVGVTVSGASGLGPIRLRLTATGDCNTANDEFDAVVEACPE